MVGLRREGVEEDEVVVVVEEGEMEGFEGEVTTLLTLKCFLFVWFIFQKIK